MATIRSVNHPMQPLPTFGGGTMLGAAASIQKGDVVFQRYTLHHVLGVGGMGVVWLATDDKLGQEVALKFVPDPLRHDAEAIQDLKNQTKLGLKLTHENIVRVLGFENDEKLAAVSMEYVDGPTLASMRVDQPAQVFEADSLHVYLLGILTALEYAHEQARIVHRDLKPANVLVNSEDRVKVADFGIACSIRNSVGKVMSVPERSGSGTLHYMSPQALLGGPACVADDIYSLAATVFELMTGTPPFHSGDVATQVREIPAPSMTARRQQNHIEGEPIPPAWEEVVAAALAKDGSLRPSSVAEFRKGLLGQPFKRGTGSATAREGAVAIPVRQMSQAVPAKPPSRSRTVMFSSVAALVVIVVVAVILFWDGGNKPPVGSKPDNKDALIAQTMYFKELQKRAEDFEAETLPAKDKLSRWSGLLGEIRASDFQSDPAVRKILQRAEDRMDFWREEGRKAHMAYTVEVSDLKKATEDATKLSEQKDKGAAAKADKWNETVKKFVPIFALMDDETAHVATLEDAKKQAASWQAKADSESPKSLPPEKLVFVGGPAGNWAEYGRKEMLTLVQSALAFKGSQGVTATGVWDNATFQALKSWQKEKGLPTSGVLDAITIEALGLQGMPEPKQPTHTVAQTKPDKGSGGGSSNSGGVSRTSSKGSTDAEGWARIARDHMSGGRGFPMPGGFR